MSNHRLDYASRKISEAFARANERRAKELVRQQEQQAIAQHAQQMVQQLSDLTSQVNAITKPITKPSDEVTGSTANAITSLERDEQYRTTIIQLMVNHIRQKKEKQND